MHGARKQQYMNEQHERAMTAPIERPNDDEEAAEIEQRITRAREAGL